MSTCFDLTEVQNDSLTLSSIYKTQTQYHSHFRGGLLEHILKIATTHSDSVIRLSIKAVKTVQLPPSVIDRKQPNMKIS